MIYGTGRDGLNLCHIHHKPCTHHPSYDPAPAAADDSELEKRRGNPEKHRPHLLCSIHKLCTQFWFQATRGKTAVDAYGQNVGNHMAGITMEVCQLIESKTKGDHGKAGVAFLGGDLAQLLWRKNMHV
ncbi:hypothetical protein BT93_D0370 [Corymbia citriodora subsp. variegata]|nr:hypothetical protein BT93_D0370 [Corymbia citriodora subsp. variegata]